MISRLTAHSWRPLGAHTSCHLGAQVCAQPQKNPGLNYWRQSTFRTYTSAHLDKPVVDLLYDLLPSDTGTRERPIVMLHGFLGSRRNWRTLARTFAKNLDRPVYTLDLRNHGNSPRATPMDYTSMATDVQHFLASKSLSEVCLIGHSMGGKVASLLALTDPSLLSSLIIEDTAPAPAPPEGAEQNMHYVELMERINELSLDDKRADLERKQVDAMLLEMGVEDITIRQFLLTNFAYSCSIDARRRGYFHPPLEIMKTYIHNLSAPFPLPLLSDGSNKGWGGKVLVVRGSKSPYLDSSKLALLKDVFPNMQLTTLDAGHWVHAERPGEFGAAVEEFLKG
ncbi:Alpha/Beta hydrolase protein [Pterulicium gracile]|uniref:Alpha/Beta hydrolase protein n=1 Tax=Pterulicium gracile TaxID=1884261 RepID=A0A5C3Q8V5_9AGAR|nr:Alpha/Beta hydrolase protein [Pterula gracilis]